MAIHDARYSSRPATFREFRWRLLHLYEERVGRRISEAELQREATEAAGWARAAGELS